MKNWMTRTGLLWLIPLAVFAQDKQDNIVVTGTSIPQALLIQNYGDMPKGVGGYDLSICNATEQRQTVTSTEVYQALAQANVSLQPIGRQIMLASILRNQSKNLSTILSVALNSATGVVAVLSSSSSMNVPNSLKTSIGLGSIMLTQLSSTLKPVLAPDKVEKFDREVLESALVLDSGSCVERTVFTIISDPKAKPAALQFRVRNSRM